MQRRLRRPRGRGTGLLAVFLSLFRAFPRYSHAFSRAVWITKPWFSSPQHGPVPPSQSLLRCGRPGPGHPPSRPEPGHSPTRTLTLTHPHAPSHVHTHTQPHAHSPTHTHAHSPPYSRTHAHIPTHAHSRVHSHVHVHIFTHALTLTHTRALRPPSTPQSGSLLQVPSGLCAGPTPSP